MIGFRSSGCLTYFDFDVMVLIVRCYLVLSLCFDGWLWWLRCLVVCQVVLFVWRSLTCLFSGVLL